MAIFILTLASFFEVVTMVNLEKSKGLKILKYTILAVIFQLISVYLLSIGTLYVSLNVAYAMWTGLGIVGTFLYGRLFLHDKANYQEYLCIFLIIIGLVGLKMFA